MSLLYGVTCATGAEIIVTRAGTLWATGGGRSEAADDAGQRFVMVRDDTTVGRLRVILNWRPESAAAAAPPR